ncbi:MAG: MBL fold metallo-hydrolase [Gammaproteobacteria bacterium]|nr:MBL fold metallo-hydrolase [Gammaproteobacteria bacterium]MDH5653462.1 MBL fold metallo-hydrolase [Gammaproteobacteria bacterium]
MFSHSKTVSHLLLTIGLCSLFTSLQAADLSIKKDYPLEKLTNRVHVIHGPNEEVSKANQGFRNNPVLITTAEGIVVIDPGSSLYTGEMVVNKARSLSNKPVIAVFITHEHGDHWLGNHGIKKHYPNAVIYAHEAAINTIKSDEGAMWITSINRMADGQIAGTKVVAPDKPIKDGDRIKLGGVTFRIYNNGKAHSNSDIMIEIVEEKVFVFGDNLRDQNVSLFMAGFKGNLAALDIGQKSGAKYFVPGHGKSGDKAIIDRYRRFLIDLKGAVQKNFAAGMSDFEMKPVVIKALHKYKHWSGFEENIGKLINLAYLEVENESF